MRIVVVVFRRPGTRQVCRITVVFRTSIEQEAADFRRRLMIQLGVMKNRSMLVKRHDVAVWHVGVAVTGGSQVSEVDVKLAHSGTERFFCCTVSIYRHFLRFAHTGQFVVRFIGTVIMQVVDHPFRVDVAGRDVQLQGTFRNRANVTDIAASSRQLATDTIRFRQRDDLDFFRPERGRQRLNVVPVIDRQVEPQFRLVYAIHQQPAVRNLRDRHPGFELRIDLKRVRMIVEKDVNKFA